MTAAAPAIALLQPELSPDGPRPPPPPRANLVHFDTIIDYVLTHPGATNREIAVHIRRGEPWVSLVMRSDAFLAHYRARRAVLDATVTDGVKARLASVAERAANVIIKRLDENPLGITIDQATNVLDKATARLGFGQPTAPAGVNVTVGTGAQTAVFVASPEQLARAREKLRDVQLSMGAVADRGQSPVVAAGVRASAPAVARSDGAALPSSDRFVREPNVEDIEVVSAPPAPAFDDLDVEVKVGRDA